MIGNNSCGVHSVMAEFYGPGRGRRTTCTRSTSSRTAASGCGSARRTRDCAIIGEGGRRASCLGSLARPLRRPRSAQRYPDIPRRVSGYNLDDLLPEKGFHVARALVGSEGTCVTVLEATRPPDREPAVPHARRRSATTTSTTAADDVPAVLEHRAVGLEGFDDVLIEDMTRTRPSHRARPVAAAATAAAGCWSSSAARRRRRPTSEARALMARARARAAAARAATKLYDDADERTARLEGARGGARRDGVRPGQAGHLRGLGGLGRAARAARRLPARAAEARSTGTATSARSTATSGRAACTRASTSTSHATHGIDDVPPVPRRRGRPRRSRYGGSLSGEHGDGQSRAELLPKMFGDGARRGVPRVQVDLGSRRHDEPGQGRRPAPDRPRTCASARATGRRRPQTHFAYPATTAAASRTRRSLRRHRQLPPRATAA